LSCCTKYAHVIYMLIFIECVLLTLKWFRKSHKADVLPLICWHNHFIPQSFLHPSFCYCDLSFTAWMISVSMLLCLRHWLSGWPIKLLILWSLFRCSNFVCVSLVGRLQYSMVHQLCKAVSYVHWLFFFYFCCIFLTQHIQEKSIWVCLYCRPFKFAL
jgi:hypothetical protein